MKTKTEQEGYDAFKQGKALVDNPHIGNQYRANEWKTGWLSAYNLDNVRKVLT